MLFSYFFFSSRRRHTRCALVTGVQTCALPIFGNGRKILYVAPPRLGPWPQPWMLPTSTRRPGPIVEDSETRLMNVPFAPVGLAREMASTKARMLATKIGRAACRERVCQYV